MRAALLAALATAEANEASSHALVVALRAALAEPEPTTERYMTLAQAAEAKGISVHTLRSWARSGRLATKSGTRGTFLVTESGVDDAVSAGPPRRKVTPESDSLDDWDAAANRALRLVGKK